jgi:ParB family chromosome partitioning protein
MSEENKQAPEATEVIVVAEADETAETAAPAAESAPEVAENVAPAGALAPTSGGLKKTNAAKTLPALDQVQHISLEDVIPNPNQPRKHFDETALEGLASSIRASGLLQPILISQKGENGKHIIIAGERRFRAVQAIKGRKTIEAIVREVTPEQMYTMSATENITREDMTPLEVAMVYRHFETQGKSQGAIATLFGIARPTVVNYLALLDLPKEITDELAKKDRRLEMAHAKALKGIKDHPEVMMVLFNRIITEGLPVRWAEEQVAEAKKKIAAGEDAQNVLTGAQDASSATNRQAQLPTGEGATPQGATPPGATTPPAGTTPPVAPEPEIKLPEPIENLKNALRKAVGNDVKIKPGSQAGEYLIVIGPCFGPMDLSRIGKKVGVSEDVLAPVRNLQNVQN